MNFLACNHRIRYRFAVVRVSASILLATTAAALGQDATNDRLDELEDQIIELEERVGDRAVVHAFDAIQLDIGGFATQTFTSVMSKDHTRGSFDLGQFELFIKGEIDNQWSTFTLLEFKRTASQTGIDFGEDPSDIGFGKINNKAELELYEINYSPLDAVNFKVGRFITQHGIINIEHFHPTLLHIPYPMFMRQGFTSTFFPRFSLGGEMYGRLFMGKDDADILSYSWFIGSQKGDSDDFNWGTRVAYAFADGGITVAGNYGGNENGTDFIGADLLIDKGQLLWKNEIYTSIDTPTGEDRVGFYTQPAWRFTEKLIGFYRFDYLDPGSLEAGVRTEHVVGVNYLFTPVVRGRAALTFADFGGTNDTAEFLQLSLTISF